MFTVCLIFPRHGQYEATMHLYKVWIMINFLYRYNLGIDSTNKSYSVVGELIIAPKLEIVCSFRTFEIRIPFSLGHSLWHRHFLFLQYVAISIKLISFADKKQQHPPPPSPPKNTTHTKTQLTNKKAEKSENKKNNNKQTISTTQT